MTDGSTNCLTCRQKADDSLRLSDKANGEDIGAVVACHFWFPADQYEDRVLCGICWEKIEDFHKFYCEVKELWDHDYFPGGTTDIKTEDDDEDVLLPELLFTSELIKEEVAEKGIKVHSLKAPDGHVSNDEVLEETADDSEEDSTVPIAKRYKRNRSKEIASKRDKPVRRKQLSRTEEKPLRKQAVKKRGGSLLQCDHCDVARLFKREDSLQMHQLISHSGQLEKKFQCDQCQKGFAFEWMYSAHMSWHQKAGLNITCHVCNKYFHTPRTLKNHIKANHTENMTPAPDSTAVNAAIATTEPEIHTSDEDMDELIRKFCPLICDKCEFVAESFQDLKKHFSAVHKQHVYAKCCDKKFFKKRMLFQHCQWHEHPDLFRCEVCNKSFTEKEGIDRHNIWVHTPDSEKPFKCEICDSAYASEYLLIPHMKYHFSMEKKSFICKDCGKPFGSEHYLRTHEQTIHGTSFNFVCDICAKGFASKSFLDAHRLTHTKEGAASLKKQCEHCKKWLKNRSSHKRHVLRCLSDGPVKCDLCGKDVANLPDHKRTNHVDRPLLTCSYCGKQFKRAIRHKEHEANHRGEVLYSCPFCPYSCNSNSNMYTHKHAAHAEQWAAKLADRFYRR